MATPRATPSLASSSPDAKLLQRDVIDAQLHIGYDPDSEHTDRRNILGLLGQETSSEFQLADKDAARMPGNTSSLSSLPDSTAFIETAPSSSAFSALGDTVSGNAFPSMGGSPALGTLKDTGISTEMLGDNSGSQSSLPNADVQRNSSAQVSPNGGGGGGAPEGPGTPETPSNDPNTLTAPDVSGNGSSGLENAPVPVTINLSADPDATSTYVVIGNIPAGASLSAGVDNHDGTWTLTPAQLIGLTMTPPPYYSGDIHLSVTAVSTGNGQTLSDTAIITVEIEGVATAPLLSAQSATGLEDTAIPLSITSTLIDTDGSENLSLLVAQVPSGAVLSAGTNNGNGTWTLSPSQLTGLSITPPQNFSGQINLLVSATSSENGTTATTQTPLSVWVGGVADTPVVSVQSAMGVEDTSIPLDITAMLTDTDGSETLSIVVGNMPAGSSLSAGINNGNGTWTLSPAQLSGLTFLPPQHTGGVFSLSVTATASENGTSSSLTTSLSVTVSGSATPPFLAVPPASGNEDTPIPLSISAGLTDTDGSETLLVTISNVPAGATLSAGNNLGGGVWSLIPAQLSGLSLLPPSNFSGIITLGVTATASEGSSTSILSQSLPVTVEGVADAPALTTAPASGAEDTAIALNISAALTDTDGSEIFSILIAGVPAGAILSAGLNNGNGTWSLTPAQLTGLTLTPPLHSSGVINLSITATSFENGTSATSASALAVSVTGSATPPSLSVAPASGAEDTAIPLSITSSLTDTDGSETLVITVSNVPAGASLSAGINQGGGVWTLTPAQLSGVSLTPPLNFSGIISLNITATSQDGSDTSSLNAILPVTISGVADNPVVTAGPVTGTEDTPIPLNISAVLTDTDGSEILSVVVSGVPAGASLSAGTDNGNGTWTLTASDLPGLTLLPPAHSSTPVSLTITATASENGTTATTSGSMTVTVNGSATTPTLSVSNSTGNEDTAIPLTITSSLIDTDGSETLSITISNVPPGAILSAGTDLGSGTWSLSPAQLAGLTLTPPNNFSGVIALNVVATSQEGSSTATTPSSLTVTVAGVADAPTLSVTPANGPENSAIPLGISASLTDTDGSESLSIVLSGIPSGATLSAGTDNGDGSWTLSPAQLAGLTLTPPPYTSGTLSLTVSAVASEGGTTATSTSAMSVVITSVGTPPILSVSGATGQEDTAIPLTISAALVDLTETLTITIGNVPAGATLSAGINNGNGTWTLAPSNLTGLTIIPPSNYSGQIDLTITATSSDGVTSASILSTLPVIVGGVADTPLLSVQPATGAEESPIPLLITSTLTDTDGSESLVITISNVPAGAVLSAGVDTGGGVWTLTPSQLSGLTLTPPASYSGTISLSLVSTASENGTSASTSPVSLPVTVTGAASTPLLSVSSASGSEDTAIPLSISAALTDTDGSETLSITIANVPAGATLSAGINNGNGSWTLTPAQLAGLSLIPPANFSGLISLSVTALSSEGSTTSSLSANLPVTVTGVADTPLLSAQNVLGSEDTAIPLNISAALTDTDGSETLSITISNLPAGATLSAGTNNGNGSWTLTPAQLTGLTLTPPLHASGIITLNVSATASEGASTATTSTSFSLNVQGAATLPNLSVTPASGSEDTAIPLNISAALTDTDGSEILGITISNVPAGANLSAGIYNGSGIWTLTPAQLTGLTLIPPAHFSGNFSLSVVATSYENATNISTSALALPVSINAVADTPLLSVQPATGSEDTAIPLVISSALVDIDGSEALSIVIHNVPAGAILSSGIYAGNGDWSLTPSQLAGLTLTPPANFSGVMALTVSAVSTEQTGDDTITTLPLTVTVTGVVDAPHLTLSPVTGSEDTQIALNISAILSDTDGSEVLSVLISGVPAGASLSAGSNIGGGSWSLTAAQLANLRITPPVNSNADFTLNVSVTSTESGGGTSTVTAPLAVNVTGVADLPTATASNASGASGVAIPLTLNGSLSDTDGSETITYVLHGMPDGFALNHGVNNGDNTWTLTQSQLSGLTLMSPHHFDGQLNLRLTAVSHENDGDTRVSNPAAFHVRIGDYANGYLIDLGIGIGIGGIGLGINAGIGPNIDLFPAAGGLLGIGGMDIKEDTPYLIADAPALLGLPILAPVLALIATIQFSGIPAGTTFSAGTNMGGGVWRFTLAQLNNLYITPPANSDADFTITVAAKLLLGLADVALISTPVHVLGIADIPSLTASSIGGTEDQSFALTISGSLTDLDGSESISFLVSGMPPGFTLNHGINNGNGTWSLTSAQLAGLMVNPSENFSGTANITVSAIATEREGDQTVRQQTVSLNIAPAIDGPQITVHPAFGTEDQSVVLNLGISLPDADGSEHITSVTLSALPPGATLTGATNNGNGTWSADIAHLNQISITPPHDYSGDFNINVSVTVREGTSGPQMTVNSILPVHIEGVADTPNGSAADVSGISNHAIPLSLSTSLNDTDGSESLSVVISGLPDHFTLTAGLNNGDGSWTLSDSQLANLSLMAAEDYVGNVDLTMTVFSHEDNGSVASLQQDFTVHVTPDI